MYNNARRFITLKIQSNKQAVTSASLWKSFLGSLSFLSQTLGKYLDEIMKYGLEVKPVKVDKNHLEYIIDCGDLGELHAWADREQEEDENGNSVPYKMKMEFEGAEKDLGTHELDEMYDLINKEFREITGLDLKKVKDEVRKEKNMSSSYNVKASFRKITCGKTAEVRLTAVECSDSPSTALMVIDNVLDDEEFIESLPEDKVVSYDIQDENDDIAIVELAEEFEVADSYEACRVCATKLLDILQTIHVNAKGKEFDRLHRNTESLFYDIRYHIDTLAEWSVQHFGSAKSCNQIARMYEFNVSQEGYTFDDALPVLRYAIQEYIDCLQLYYCNMSNTAQTTVDNWITSLDKIANYKLARTAL